MLWITCLIALLSFSAAVFLPAFANVSLAKQQTSYRVVSQDGDYTVIQKNNKYGVLYKKRAWLPVVYDKIVVDGETDSQFYILAKKGKGMQIFFQPKEKFL